MTKYSTAVQTAKFDAKTGFCSKPGWLTAYNTDPVTREYTGATYEYVVIGIALLGSYTDEPELPSAGYALRRTADGSEWEHARDYRGKTAYNTVTAEEVKITEMGEMSATLTLIKPTVEYPIWDGKKWVEDAEAKKKAAIAEATTRQANLLTDASAMITPLADAVELDVATDAEKERLKRLKKYRIELTRIDVNSAPDIDWPEFPEAESQSKKDIEDSDWN